MKIVGLILGAICLLVYLIFELAFNTLRWLFRLVVKSEPKPTNTKPVIDLNKVVTEIKRAKREEEQPIIVTTVEEKKVDVDDYDAFDAALRDLSKPN